jgi:hypothetical protein
MGRQRGRLDTENQTMRKTEKELEDITDQRRYQRKGWIQRGTFERRRCHSRQGRSWRRERGDQKFQAS